MIGGLPLNPDGHDAEAIHAKWVNDEFTLRRKLSQTDGLGISRTTRGDFVNPSELQATAGGARLKLVLLRDVKDDYLVCHSWDGETEGTTNLYVAKQFQHRTSRTTDTILGVNYTFTYSPGPSEAWGVATDTRFNKVRHSNDGSTTEDQRIVPPWMDGEAFWCVRANTNAERGTDPSLPISDTNPAVKIGLLILGRSTLWCRKAD